MKHILTKRLWKLFIELVTAYQEQKELSQQELADIVGMQRSHLCAILNQDPSRPLTAYYIMKFLRKGVFTVTDIYDGKAETKRELDFWAQAKEAENFALLGKIARLRESGIDVADLLDRMYPNI